MTKFRQVSSEVSRDIVEEEEDVEVRAWLEAAGADGMQWVSMLDELRITVGGTQPQHTGMKFKRISLEEILKYEFTKTSNSCQILTCYCVN